MPTATFSTQYLKRFTQLSPEQLVQLGFDYGLDVSLRGDWLEVEVTAERPDLLSASGFCRAMNLYSHQPRSLPRELETSGRSLTVLPAVLPLRPYIAALVIEGVDLGEEALAALVQFQEKVTQTFGRQRKKMAIGIYDLAQIVGDLTYTAIAQDELTFVPLDRTETMTAREILATHPSGILYTDTLPQPGETIGPRWVPVLQDSQGQVLSMPPIVNARGPGEVTAQSQQLLIDVTGTVERTVLEMASIWAHNFLDLGATVKTVEVITPTGRQTTPRIEPKSIQFSIRFLNQTVGTAIAKTDLPKVLQRMDLAVTGTDQILVPSYRTDILSQTDIAGDLLVAVGIDQLKPELPGSQFYTGKTDPLKDLARQVSDIAQRMQLMEVRSFVLSDPEVLAQFEMAPVEIAPVEIAPAEMAPAEMNLDSANRQNSLPSSSAVLPVSPAAGPTADSSPISSPPWIYSNNAKSRTYSVTRHSLQPGLLGILARNINAPKPVNLYETGEIITRIQGHPSPSLPESGEFTQEVYESLYWGFASLDPRASFATAKAYTQTLLKALGVTYTLHPCSLPRYIPGRAAQVEIQGAVGSAKLRRIAGHFGEIHPRILHYFSFPEPVCSGELDCHHLLLC